MSFENGYAVIIGVNENKVYPWALPIALNDVLEISKVLRDPDRCGFPADNLYWVTHEYASKKGILNALEWLKNKIDENPHDTTAIIYFAGHGCADTEKDPPEFYLIPYDVSKEDIRGTALKGDEFAAKVNMLKSRRLFVVLDCCHSGLNVKDFVNDIGLESYAMPTNLILKEKERTPNGSREEEEFDAFDIGEGRAVLTSSRKKQNSFERKDQIMSIFTYHLIEALMGLAQPIGGAAEVLVSDIDSYVFRKVPVTCKNEWNKQQVPDRYEIGNFPIALILGGKGLQKRPYGLPPDPLDYAEKHVFDETKYISQDPEKEGKGRKPEKDLDLAEFLGVPWAEKHQPKVSEKLREKIDIAVNMVLAGKRVVILGEAGIGKTTLLYQVCRRLLELDIKLCTGVPPLNKKKSVFVSDKEKSVFVSDNLARNLKLLIELSRLNIGVIATSRRYEWLNSEGKGWIEIELTKDDYPAAILKDIIREVAKEKGVECKDKNAIEEAIRKSDGSPGYLVALIDYLKQLNTMLDMQAASTVPSTIYAVEAQQLCDIANKDSLSILILYAIAKTKRARLHMVQLGLLTKFLDELLEGKPQKIKGEMDLWTQITDRDQELYTIMHDTWKDLLLMDWKKLRIETFEPKPLIVARNLYIKAILEDVLESSLSRLEDAVVFVADIVENTMDDLKKVVQREQYIKGILEDVLESSLSRLSSRRFESSVQLAQVALENQPELVAQLIEITTTTDNKYLSKMKPRLLDLAAINNPDETDAWLQGLNKQELINAQLDIDEAPSYMIRWCQVALEKEDGDSSSLLDKSNREISCVLDIKQKLGAAYHGNFLYDEAIDCLVKALNDCRQVLNRDAQFKPILANILTSLGESYSEKGSHDESINCLTEALNLNREINIKNKLYNPDLARALRVLGLACWWKDRLKDARDYSSEAVNIYRQEANKDENLKDELARTLVLYGSSCREIGDLKEAQESLQEAFKIYGELSRRYWQAYALYNLGAAYWWSGKLDEAANALKEARTIDLEFADRNDVRCLRDLTRTLANLGRTYMWQGHTDEAIDCLKDAIDYSNKLTVKGQFKSDLVAYVCAGALCNLGAAYQRKRKFDEAISCLSEALEINCAISEKTGASRLRLVDILIHLGLIFAMRGKADEIKIALNLNTHAKELLKKERELISQKGFSLEYVVIVERHNDLQSLLEACKLSDTINLKSSV